MNPHGFVTERPSPPEPMKEPPNQSSDAGTYHGSDAEETSPPELVKGTPNHSTDANSSSQSGTESPHLTTESPVAQIPAPPIALRFGPFSCNWLSDSYLCYDQDSPYCVVIDGSRPPGPCILTQPFDDNLESEEAKYYCRCSSMRVLLIAHSG